MNAGVPLDDPFIRTTFPLESQPASSTARATHLHNFQLNSFLHNFGENSSMASKMKDRKVRVLCAHCFFRTKLFFCNEALLIMEFSTSGYFILMYIITDWTKLCGKQKENILYSTKMARVRSTIARFLIAIITRIVPYLKI